MAKPKRCADTYEEEEYERMHVDPAALNEVFDIVKRLRGGKGFLGPLYEWFDSVCPSNKVRLSYKPSQVSVDDDLRESAVETRKVLKSAAATLYKIWEHTSHLLEVCEGNITAYDNRRGFFHLPDEILSTVLEYAVPQDARHARRELRDVGELDEDRRNKVNVQAVRSAAKLSHVCKRFRDLIITSPCLWRQVSSGMGEGGMVSTCLDRCRPGNAEVTLFSSLFETGRTTNTSFLRAVLARTENWECFILNGDGGPSSRFDAMEDAGQELEDYVELAKEHNLPNLKNISVSYPRASLRSNIYNDARFRDTLHFYSSWSAPRLQSITATNFIPIPFSGSASLSSLSLTLDFNTYINDATLDVNSLASLLSTSPDLKTFKLFLTGALQSISPSVSETRLVSSNATELEIHFYNCRSDPVKNLFCAIGFPRASNIHLDIRARLEGDDKNNGLHFNDVFYAVIPHANAFPNLSDLSLVVNCWGTWIDRDENESNKEGSDVRQRNRVSISIPFTVFPKLRNLTLMTLQSEVDLIPDGLALPAILGLSFMSCRKLKKEWLVGFLKQIEAQGGLESLSVSVDEDSEVLGKCGLRGVLSKDDIHKLIQISNADVDSVS